MRRSAAVACHAALDSAEKASAPRVRCSACITPSRRRRMLSRSSEVSALFRASFCMFDKTFFIYRVILLGLEECVQLLEAAMQTHGNDVLALADEIGDLMNGKV